MKRKLWVSPKLLFFLLFSSCLIAQIDSSAKSRDLEISLKYFREAAEISKTDDGKLWGLPLYGPLLFVDSEARNVIANQSDLQGILKKEGEVFVGKLPKGESIANTATSWAGVKWTMLMWPLPENEFKRKSLIMHEQFHRIQDDIGFRMRVHEMNDHLDTFEGRIWLQLEWRALGEALLLNCAKREEAMKDAIVFRSLRRKLFPGAFSSEQALEMNEGLAEYTGLKLCSQNDSFLHDVIGKKLEKASLIPTFVRSFAYYSGPAYGVLLDDVAPGWRKNLKPSDDLGSLLQKCLSFELPTDLEEKANAFALKYDWQNLRSKEEKREAEKKKRLAQFRAKLVDGPILILPLHPNSAGSFDPNNIIPLENHKTIFPTYTAIDEWGILEVENGALKVWEEKSSEIHVAAPTDSAIRPLKGDGWILELKPNWNIIPGKRKGDFTLEMSK